MRLKSFLAFPVLVSVLALAGVLGASVLSQKSITSTGTITTSPNVGVFSDSACTVAVSVLNWGAFPAGGSGTQMIYVKNTGTGSMALNMAVSGWAPQAAATWIAISWDREGAVLSAGQSVATTLTVRVDAAISGVTSFSNTITLSGTG